MRTIGVVCACVLLGACSTILEGRAQQIVVNTNPPGADCGLYRQSLMIGRIQSTPGGTLVEKTKYDVWIACVKQGYQQATYYNHSGIDAATFGNIILGGGVGWAIDSATGADNRYDSPVNITMAPVQPGQPEAPAALPTTFVGVAPPTGSQPTPQQAPVQQAPAEQQTPGQASSLTN